MSNTVRIALLGDVMLGRGVNEEIHRHPVDYVWGDTLPVLRSMDAVFANLECAITAHKKPWSKTYKSFHFRAEPDAVKVLQIANIRCVSLANNHSLDFDTEGLLDTLQLLNQAGIVYAGAGKDQLQADEAAILDIAGVRIGFIAYTDNEPAFAAEPSTPGSNYLEIDTQAETLARLESDIGQLKAKNADLMILSLHWGGNWPKKPSAQYQDFAHAAIERGIHIVYGHSPHIFQAVEPYGHGWILYSAGDFLDDYAVDPILRNDWSFIFVVEVQKDRVAEFQAIPVRLKYAQTHLARDREADAICERMQQLCAPFQHIPTRTLEGLEFSHAGRL
jgi:poly-gamma-glutamate synthesis protein (capsule biosynthesis protein)